MKDLQFRRFGRLTVVCSIKKRSKWGLIIWLCRCICGNLTMVTGSSLISGTTKSCGCFKKDKMALLGQKIKHGDDRKRKRMRLYRIWLGMRNRCLNSNNPAYKYYGGYGITICDEWKNNYQAFKFWALLNGYQFNLTIDRIENDGNYEPLNCQWITRSENSKKKRRKIT